MNTLTTKIVPNIDEALSGTAGYIAGKLTSQIIDKYILKGDKSTLKQALKGVVITVGGLVIYSQGNDMKNSNIRTFGTGVSIEGISIVINKLTSGALDGITNLLGSTDDFSDDNYDDFTDLPDLPEDNDIDLILPKLEGQDQKDDDDIDLILPKLEGQNNVIISDISKSNLGEDIEEEYDDGEEVYEYVEII